MHTHLLEEYKGAGGKWHESDGERPRAGGSIDHHSAPNPSLSSARPTEVGNNSSDNDLSTMSRN